MARRPLRLLIPVVISVAAATVVMAGCSRSSLTQPSAGPTSSTGPGTAGGTGSAGSPASSSAASSPSVAAPSSALVASPTARPPAATTATAPPPPTATADDIALATSRAWLSYDTRLDRRPNDTALRLALPLLTPQLRQQLQAYTPAAAPGVDWDTWTSHHAHATVAVRLGGDDHPPDTPTTAWRQVLATVTLRGDPGWSGEVLRVSQFLQLARTPQGWRVAQLTATHST